MSLDNSLIIIKGRSSTSYSHFRRGLDGGTAHPYENNDNSVWLSQPKDTYEKTSTIWVKLDHRDFGELARLMLTANREVALQAFAEAIIETVPE